MTEKQFTEMYSQFVGEPIDNIAQINTHTFNGYELKGFVEFVLSVADCQVDPKKVLDDFIDDCIFRGKVSSDPYDLPFNAKNEIENIIFHNSDKKAKKKIRKYLLPYIN